MSIEPLRAHRITVMVAPSWMNTCTNTLKNWPPTCPAMMTRTSWVACAAKLIGVVMIAVTNPNAIMTSPSSTTIQN